MRFSAAAQITTGYTETVCVNKDCNEMVWMPPWYKPYGEYCDKCRPDAKEHFEDESREFEEDENE